MIKRKRVETEEPFPEAREMQIRRQAFTHLPYPNGSLKTIEFVQFLTFDHVFMEPGPNLNVLIGPNGSGKSSIICGICLAMGGNPKILGRSERYADYVKHNEKKAFVEVTVTDNSKPSGEVRYRIVIDRAKNSAEYFIDRSKVSRTIVFQSVHNYNIQIENPCTFLAQDKVKSFAAQDPKELLMNTQKAGNLELLKKHEEILTKKKDEKIFTTRVAEFQSALEQIQNEIVALEPKVEAFKKQESMEGRIKLLRKKAAILTFKSAENNYEEVAKATQLLKNDLQKLEDELENIKEQSTKFSKKLDTVDERRKEVGRKRRNFEETVTNNEDPAWYKNQLEDVKDKLDREKVRLRTWEQNLLRLQQSVDQAKATMQKAQTERDNSKQHEVGLRQKADDLGRRLLEIGSRESQTENSIMDLRGQRRRTEDVEERNHNLLLERLNSLSNLGSARDAYMFYQNNKSKFRHPIYVPMLDITIRGGDAELTLLSNVLNRRDGTTFVFGCKEDEILLTQRFNKINTTVVDATMVQRGLAQLAEWRIPDEAQQAGILGTMLDIIECNDVIRAFLSLGCSWHRLLRGAQSIDDKYAETANFLKKWLPSGAIFTNQNQINWSMSHYSGEVLVEQNSLDFRRKQYFMSNKRKYERLDTDLIKRIEEEQKTLEKRRQELDKEKGELTAERTKIHRDLQEFYQHNEAVQHARRIFGDKQAELSFHERSKPKIELLEQEFNDCKRKALNGSLRRFAVVMETMVELQKAKLEYSTVSHLASELRQRLDQLLTNKDRLTADQTMNKKKLENQEKMIHVEKQTYKEARESLRRLVKLDALNEDKFSKEQKKLYDDLQKEFEEDKIPKDKDEVDRLIADEENRIRIVQGAGVGTSSDVAQFERLKRRKAENELKKEQAMESYKDFEEELGKDIDEWVIPLEELVRKISENFTKFFGLMEWRGQVTLEKPENKLDVEKYGIAINVSFRDNEKIRRLDDRTQSGGERSVSTMLYLLSLQELCPVPFRCVDEINQGMDPRNERKVFSLIVDTLATTGNLAKTQYFLLTPKLLRGLKYGEKVAVHIVHNSPTLPNEILEWDHSAFLAIMPTLNNT